MFDTAQASPGDAAAVEPTAATTTPEQAPTTETEAPAPLEGREKLDQLWNSQTEPPQPPENAPEEVKETAPEVKEEAGTEGSSPEEEEDPLAEFEEKGIITDEEIDKVYERSSKTVRNEMKSLAAQARKGTETVEKLGGETALPFYEKLAKPLFSAEVDSQSVEEVLNTVYEANPALLARMSNEIFDTLLDSQKGEAAIEAKLQKKFGEGYTSEKLQELVNFKEAGLLDEDALGEEWKDSGEIRLENRRLQQELAKVQSEQVKPLQEAQKQFQERQQVISEITETSDAYVLEQAKEAINPIIESLGWAINDNDPEDVGKAKGILSEMTQAWLKDLSLNSPEAKHIRHLIENNQAFDAKGNPSRAYQVQLEKIASKAKASMIRAARPLSKTFTKSLLGSRNAQLIANSQSSQPQPPPPNYAPPPPATGESLEEMRARAAQLGKLAFGQAPAADTAVQQRMANGR